MTFKGKHLIKVYFFLQGKRNLRKRIGNKVKGEYIHDDVGLFCDNVFVALPV